MKKIVVNFIFLIFFLIILLIITLSTIGIETNKFNNLIAERAAQSKKIDLRLNTIRFKLDPKQLSLFLETKNPKINYQGLEIPVENAKVYIDFLSLFKSDTKINKINLKFDEISVVKLSELSAFIKPSNFKSLLNNKINKGRLIFEIDIFLDNEGSLKNFIAKGNVKNLEGELLNNFNLTKTNFSFFSDKSDILIKNISGKIENIQISDGDIKLNLENGVKLNSNFNSKIYLDKNFLNKYPKFFNIKNFNHKIKNLQANLNNNIFINFDNTYKIKDYNYTAKGEIKNSDLELKNAIKNDFLNREIKNIYFSNLKIETTFSPNSLVFNGDGKYSLDNSDFLKVNFTNKSNDNSLNLKLELDYKNSFKIDLINYKKPNDSIANLVIELEKKKNKINIKKLNLKERENIIKIKDLSFQNSKFNSFKRLEVKTQKNNFFVQKDNKILIKGSKFDASNLAKFLNRNNSKNNFHNINGEIEIDFKNIKAPMSENLKNFKLLGEIRKGQFTKISSKGDFGGNNFLDISMQKDKNTNKKYLEIYSDLPRPLLTEYSFFKGLSGGKLLFTSIIDSSNSNSKLKIENFKVVNAPGVIKLLSLADLGGLADLAEGEGLSFDLLEIDMEKNNSFLKLNEILAIGPSISVLMEGYQDEKGLTSLRGTLVPAKTLNKMISKIPVIGNIVIPKEIGEGLFGISFKLKGPKGKIKTTINPIRTLTPRFIQKIIDKKND